MYVPTTIITPSAVRYPASDIRYPLFAIRQHYPLSSSGIRYLLFSIRQSYPLSTIRYPLFATQFPLFAILYPLTYLLSAIHYPISAICHSLFTIPYPLSPTRHPPSTYHHRTARLGSGPLAESLVSRCGSLPPDRLPRRPVSDFHRQP